MPNWGSNDPSEFGWDKAFRGFVPFVYRGVSFPSGVHPSAAAAFRSALNACTARGLEWPEAADTSKIGYWGQEARNIAGSSTLSFHAYGLALDVAAALQPSGQRTRGRSLFTLPDNTSQLVEPFGILWGGSPRFGDRPDRMHLEMHMSPAELGAVIAHPVGRPVFPLPPGYYFGPLSGPANSISGAGRNDEMYRSALALAQSKVGTKADGYYGPNTNTAVQLWQMKHHLLVDGLIGPATWASLFP